MSSRAMLAVAMQYIYGEGCTKREHTWIHILPLFIAYGACSILIPFAIGMRMVIRIPMADSLTYICRKYKPSHVISSPAFWENLAQNKKTMDLSYLVAPISGGDILRKNAEEKINAYLKRCGSTIPIFNGYGMTEVAAAVACNFKGKYEFGSVGAPFVHNVIAAFDTETQTELKYGEEGEICIYTPSAMSGYLNNPKETANVLRRHADGKLWVHTGDLGFVNEDGFVYISGRLKRYTLCFHNGIAKKVFSLDVEKVLLKHKAVIDCAVVPFPDEEMNQVPVAYVILKGDMDFSQVKSELKLLCEQELEPVYHPSQYFCIDSFPRTKIGKVDYRKLEQMASEKNCEE